MSFPFTKAKAIPTLTQGDLTQDKIAGKIDLLFESDSTHKTLSKAILETQHRLRSLTSDDAWLAYLDTEEATNLRLNHMLAVSVKWAYAQGRKSREP